MLADSFVTMSGRRVELGVYVEPGKEARAAYAMDALKRSMAWDERAFGREYDLDVLQHRRRLRLQHGRDGEQGAQRLQRQICARLAETATDDDYAGIEGVIAHEYFHNWTGNRITCRDWFQLCLKEGLTVFRDQEFSADQRSAPVKRIADVRGAAARRNSPRTPARSRINVRPDGLSRDQQLLHGDGLSEGRRSHPHAEAR